MLKFLSVLLFLFAFCAQAQRLEVRGIVYEDLNKNGIQEPGELGIPNVVVSNQINTALTNQNGLFKLPSHSDQEIIFISQPTGYSGNYFQPTSDHLQFPLIKHSSSSSFSFIHASDTHIDSLNLPRMNRFREMVDSIGVNFVIITGDLIRDALRVSEITAANYYLMYQAEMSKFNIPVYSVPGNHELFGIERGKSMVSDQHPLYGKKMFQYFLGPNYYSFNYGGMHFIALDGVNYQDQWYYGGIDDDQLTWLGQDLKHVSEKTPIITFNHIPFVSAGFTFQSFEPQDFYGPQLMTHQDKLAHRHIVYNFDEVQQLLDDRPYPLALSGHYHAAQENTIQGSATLFAQTAAITRPDSFDYNGFKMRSGFTLYQVNNGIIVHHAFVPLNLPD
ncbi:MAG: metallophosphoesterase [Flammeovirgaceae bacterium]|jgi:predicted MPP superfamily phosphohydrolase|nr:metallophosphoesterase [Flammeovirgaceae bacterium]|tara:strand:+ start:1740 stop:2906 length:1167 start_codon:yes stop_codon:yes gene_type:complete